MLQVVSRHVAVSTSVVTQQLSSKSSLEAPKARPCRVSTADRSVRKGIIAHSLKDLLNKVREGATLNTAQPLGLWLRAASVLWVVSWEFSWDAAHGLDGEKISFLMPALIGQLVLSNGLVTGGRQYIATLC